MKTMCHVKMEGTSFVIVVLLQNDPVLSMYLNRCCLFYEKQRLNWYQETKIKFAND